MFVIALDDFRLVVALPPPVFRPALCARKTLQIYSHLAIADAQLAYDEVIPRFRV